MKKTNAFALAGLGGFNAHGAGFLDAARKCDVVPDLITATSGQIIVLSEWLQRHDLEKALVIPELVHNPAAQLAIALAGDPGIFRPAYPEMLRRWLTPPSPTGNPVEALLDRLVPAQLYVPVRPAADFSKIADVFNNEPDIGIIFNAYNLQTGRSVLFGNPRAQGLQGLWPRNKSNEAATRSVAEMDDPKAEPELRPITREAVESALWLSLYGFDHLPKPHLIDGAYDRSCIVAELHKFDRIFVARPLAQGWLDKGGPSNWFEVQDWQTEMWFSASYKAEVDALNQINGLVHTGKLKDDNYKEVKLIEIAPETPAGFFNYFIERKGVYKRAYDLAMEKFKEIAVAQ